jgi:hypothetical protein
MWEEFKKRLMDGNEEKPVDEAIKEWHDRKLAEIEARKREMDARVALHKERMKDPSALSEGFYAYGSPDDTWMLEQIRIANERDAKRLKEGIETNDFWDE